MLIDEVFQNLGGQFLTSAQEMTVKLQSINAFVFDWDGVFNDGVKAHEKGSPFSEPDSMGLNMLRFSYWLKNGKLPFVSIITGENNLFALDFAKREHLHAVYLKAKNKQDVINQFATKHELTSQQIAFVFDDILDLNAAKICQLAICVRRGASPLFQDFIREENLCDYISAYQGGQHAIREITELLIGLNGNYKETVSKRMQYGDAYLQYLQERNAVEVHFEKIVS